MKVLLGILLLFNSLCAFAAAQPATDAAPVVGTWEGESKCTVPGSPCHDEHVIYKITADKNSPATLSLAAYKVVHGEQQFMGTLQCAFRASEKILDCTGNTPRHDVWEFQVSAEVMEGTLRVDKEKTLYRRIHVTKKQ